MRIAFINQPISPLRSDENGGSLDIWSYQTAKRLAAHHEVSIIGAGGKDVTPKEVNGPITFHRIDISNDEFINRFLRRFPAYGWWRSKYPYYAWKIHYWGYARKAAILVRELGCDVVHIHNFSQFVPVIRRVNPRVNIVLHMHCEWLTQLSHFIISRRIQQTNMVVGCSDYISREIHSRYKKYTSRCETVLNGVDENKYQPGIRNRDYDGRHRILFVNRVSPEKGVHVLLEAIAIVQHTRSDFIVDIIGGQGACPKPYIIDVTDDPIVKRLSRFYGGRREEVYFRVLQEQVQRLGLKNHVRFLGEVPHSTIHQEYINSDILISSSVWNEPFGMSLIEAMSCGVPVIATRSGAMPEIVEDGVTGLIVERDNPEDLAQAILRLLGDKELRESMGQAGRRRVICRYSWDCVVNRLEEFYRLICNREGAK